MNRLHEDFDDEPTEPFADSTRPAVVPVADIQAVLDGDCTFECPSWRGDGECSCLRERLMALIAPAPPATGLARPASDSQVNFVKGLLDSRVVGRALRGEVRNGLHRGLTDGDCRDLIPRLQACPKPQRRGGFDDDGHMSIDGNHFDVPGGFPQNPYEQ